MSEPISKKYLGAELVAVLHHYRNMLIIIKGSPDPDVIASSFALMVICMKYAVRCTLYASMDVSLPQNKIMIKNLDIPLFVDNELPDLAGFDCYSVLDFQSAYVQKVSTILPCAVHIDHHEPVKETLPVGFKYINEKAGSVSSIFSAILKELDLKIDVPLKRRMYTALAFGIYTDTDRLVHATDVDREAMTFLSEFSDQSVLDDVSNMPFSDEIITVLNKASMNREIYKKWLISGIGFVGEQYRDSIAIVADYLLSKEQVDAVVIFALVEDKENGQLFLDASFRVKQESLDLDRFIKKITTDGGARHYKGAYQVRLDYLIDCPDRHLLWETVRMTTVAKIKHRRDHLVHIPVKGFFGNMHHHIKKFLNPKNPNGHINITRD